MSHIERDRQSIPLINTPIVTAEWLYQNLNNPGVAIADCRFSLAEPELGQQQYAKDHISHAHYFDLNRDLSSPVQTHGGRHPLPNLPQLAGKLSAIGVNSGDDDNNATLVVAYDDSRFAFASRLWWLLRYMGHTQVALLDGGFSGWNAAGYPLSSEMPAPKQSNFAINLQPDLAVDINYVKAHKDLPPVALIDSREAPRYRGEFEPIDPVAGHIPGAVNYPWKEVSDNRGYVKPADEMRDRWAQVKNAEEVITYCGSGVTACVNLLSLEIAGIKTGKLYVGSWSDWCSYEN